MVISLRQKTVLVFTLFIIAVALSYLLVEYGVIVFISSVSFIGIIVLLISELQGKLSLDNSLILIPLVVCSLPLQRIFLTSFPMQVTGQLIIFLILLFYFVKFPSQERQEYLRRISPIVFPTIAFAFSLILAYLASGNIKNQDWAFLSCLIGSIGYAYLACIFCKDLKSIRKIFWVLIGIGVVQLPVMYAMGRGWTNHLPGVLSRLSSDSWGGLASNNGMSTLRYPGLFGDYELLAEYLDMMVIFCIGISFFTSSKREQILAILTAILMIVAGFYTGTRAFIIGLGVGLVTMVVLFALKPAFWKKFKNILLIGGIFIVALYLLSTQEIFKGYIDRFLKTDLSSGYYDSRNTVWTISLLMAQKLPFTGFGTQTMEIFNTLGREIYTSPHSLYFSMLLKAGIPGVIALCVFICTPLLWMIKILLTRAKTANYPWSIVFTSIWCFWVVNEIKIEFIRYAFYMNIVFFIFGIIASYYHLAQKKSLDTQSLIG